MNETKVTELNNVYCQRFGQIAVEMGLITLDQLIAALEEQVRDDVEGRPHRLLGTIFFEQGLLTPGQIDRVLNQLIKYKQKGE